MIKVPLSSINEFLSKRWKFLLKWGVVIAAYLFLAHKLIYFTHYDQLFSWWRQLQALQLCWLAGVVVLLPLNWFLEAFKWSLLTVHIQKQSLKIAVRAVLAGISTGFFTPNRVGELVGRVLYLDVGVRKAGVALGVVNSLTQNLVMAIFGIPACLILFYSKTNAFVLDLEYFLWIALLFLALSLAVYFSLPRLSHYLAQTAIANRISDFVVGFSLLSRHDLFRVIGVSMLRYVVFCLQFFLMLRFFGIHLQAYEALIAIPTNYLLVTFLPSFAFSEMAVRSSSAVLVVGLYSGQVVNIALAGVCIWAVNFVVPMVVGSVMLIRRKV